MEIHIAPATIAMLCWLVTFGEVQTAVAGEGAPGVPPHQVYQQASDVSNAPVKNVRWDPILKQSWTVSTSLKHPERPAFASQTTEADRTAQQSSPSLQVVHAGDVVRLWRQQDHVRIELTAISQDNGRFGDSVHVRLARINSSEPQANQQFTGVVCGPADVEMQR